MGKLKAATIVFYSYGFLFILGCAKPVEPTQIHLQLPSQGVSQNSVEKLSAADASHWGLADPQSLSQNTLSDISCYSVIIASETAKKKSHECVQDNGDILMRAQDFYGLYPAGEKIELTVEPGPGKIVYLVGFAATSAAACQSFPLADGTELSAPQLLTASSVDLPDGGDIELTMAIDFTDIRKIAGCDGAFTGRDNSDFFSIDLSEQTIQEDDIDPNITVRLSRVAAKAFTVDWSLAPDGDGEASDIAVNSGQVSVAAGAEQFQVPVSLVNDSVYEGTEKFLLTLSNPSNGQLGQASAVIEVLDDEVVPTFSFRQGSSLTAVEESGPITINIDLSNPVEFLTDVTVARGGTATDSLDFTNPITFPSTLSFGPGVTTVSFGYTPVNDAIDDNGKTVIYTLTTASHEINIDGTSSPLTVTISDGD